MNATPGSYLTLTTLRLSCSNDINSGVGTGFLFRFQFQLGKNGVLEDWSVPLIITNKHVVNDCTRLETTVTIVKSDENLDDSLQVPSARQIKVIIENLQDKIILHPDPKVDIAAFSFNEIAQFIPDGWSALLFEVAESDMLNPEDRSITRAIESIMMIGYPNGLWDEVNNRPIARKGITASHPLHSWNGERQFVIDAACFPGSSGSPVFIYEDGIVRAAPGSINTGTRFKFIGVLFAGPLISQEGRIEQRTIPTSTSLITVTESMMNLGFVAHADVVNDLLPIVKAMVSKQTQ